MEISLCGIQPTVLFVILRFRAEKRANMISLKSYLGPNGKKPIQIIKKAKSHL